MCVVTVHCWLKVSERWEDKAIKSLLCLNDKVIHAKSSIVNADGDGVKHFLSKVNFPALHVY